MSTRRLRRDVRITVEYDDQTAFGSPVGTAARAEQAIRDIYHPVIDYAQGRSLADFAKVAPALLSRTIGEARFRQIAEPDGGGAWRIDPAVLFPDVSRAQPRGISLICEDEGRLLRAKLPPDYWPHAHRLLAALAGPGCSDDDSSLHPDMRAMLDAMVREEMIEEADRSAGPDPHLADTDLTFLGHNTVVVRSQRAMIIVDPFLFASSRTFPTTYQPLQLRDIGPVDAVLLTHSHPDHFDAGSLLQFPPETRVIVPHIDQETLLAVAMAKRLRELGFSYVSDIDWGESVFVEDIEIHALPFYGEQPSDGEVLHPEIRNAGNTYVVRTPGVSAAFLADSGRDGRGDVKEVASQARAVLGPVDVVFSGYRGWLTYPAQLLFSSLRRFLLFVPPWLWGARQQLMTTSDEAVDIAERWCARFLVPYADGGAPWHWRLGLGPDLESRTTEVAWLDPFPERAVQAASNRVEMPDRSVVSSPVEPVLLRPGDSLSEVREVPRLVRLPKHTWPYAAPPHGGG